MCRVAQIARKAADSVHVQWRETDHLLLRRGPYLIGAGLGESVPCEAKELKGRFVSFFDPELRVRSGVTLSPASRYFLLDLDTVRGSRAPSPSIGLQDVCRSSRTTIA